MKVQFRAAVGFSLFASTVLADSAAAQSGPEPPKLAASVAAGMAFPLHGDFGFNATEWQVGVRHDVSRHFAVQGFFDQWRHSEDDTFGTDAFSVAQHTTHVTSSFGVSALVHGSVGRVTISGGGGPGYLAYDRTFRQELTACEPSAAGACDTYENRWRSNGLSLHGVIGTDVRLASRFSAFAQFKLTGPISDFGSSHTSLTAGVRVGIR